MLKSRYFRLLLGSRTSLLHHRFHPVRNLSWNPFMVKKIEEGPPEEGYIDETVVHASQELRQKDLDPVRLKEILNELAVVENPGKRCFGLMNDVIRKLLSAPPPSTDDIIPLFNDDETIAIFNQVIDNIDKLNFESARFIPRLYLRLLQKGELLKDDEMLLNVFVKFVQYLTVLGYPEQLKTVIVAFISEHPGLSSKSYQKVNELLDSLDDEVDPGLLIKILDSFTTVNDNKSKSLLKRKIIESIKVYLTQKNDEIFSIDLDELKIFQNFFNVFANDSNSLSNLSKILECLSLNDSEIFQIEKTKIISKISTILINQDKRNLNLKLSKSTKLIQYLIESSVISKDERLVAGSTLIENIRFELVEQFDVIAFNTLIQWDVFKSSKLTPQTKEQLSDNVGLIDMNTYNNILSALINSNSFNFENELEALNQFFDVTFPEFDRNLKSFEILMLKYIKDLNYTQLKLTFDESLDNAIEWESKPNVLFKLLIVLSKEPNVDANSVFQYYKKVKKHCEFLNSESYSALVFKLLKEKSVGTVLNLFKSELPKLEKGERFQISNYLELYEVIFNWILNDCEYSEDAKLIWTVMLEKFEVPYESFLPLIKKFIEMDRPELSSSLFQELKKIHKTTGRLPPPNSEMYSYLFDKYGEMLFEEGIQEIHMMLKIDLDVNTDIKIMNSLLNAYSNLNQFDQVSNIFEQISFIPQKAGLNNETISIMLKAYTFYHIESVKRFWNNLDNFNILPNSSNLNQLIVAHCYHGKFEDAFQIVQNCENDLDIPVTKQILQSLYQWTESSDLKQRIEQWALENHDDLWKLVEKNQVVLVEIKEDDEKQPYVTTKDLRLIRGL